MRVALFVTCLTDTFLPRVGVAVVRVLRHFGCRVEFPESQTCCGQPAFNCGMREEAAALARRMVEVFSPYDAVVTPSASCAAMLREHAPALLSADPAGRAAAALAPRVFEFTRFLVDRLGVDPAALIRLSEPATMHYPCHARSSYAPDELANLLSRAPTGDVRVPRQADLCCGFGGLFALDHPETSGAMAGDRLDDLAATGARLVVCNESGCALQLAGVAHRRSLPLRFLHIAELLAESLGLLEPVE